jgi:hypothetical protein
MVIVTRFTLFSPYIISVASLFFGCSYNPFHFLAVRDQISYSYSTGLWAGRSGFYGSISGGGWEFFSSPGRPEQFWGPPSLLSNGVTGSLSLGVKRPMHEADHSPHLVPRSKKAWSYISTPQYASMAWYSVKAQGQLYLYHTTQQENCNLS